MSVLRVAAVFASALSMTVAIGAVVQSGTSPCEARVSGAEYPQVIPSQVVWERVFERTAAAQAERRVTQLSLELGIDEATLETLGRTAQSVRARLASIRGPRPATAVEASPAGRQIAAADAVLEARDDVLRSLPADALSHLRSALWAKRRAVVFTLPIAGSLVQTTDGQLTYCKVEVIGRDHPDLIPEVYAWQSYFLHMRAVARNIRVGDTFTAEGLAALQTYHLRTSVSDIALVLEVASKAAADIEGRRDSGNPETVEEDIDRIVEGARVTLLRSVSRASWIAILADARRGRLDTIFVYPPALH